MCLNERTISCFVRSIHMVNYFQKLIVILIIQQSSFRDCVAYEDIHEILKVSTSEYLTLIFLSIWR
jgi:hypothetical protein